MANDNYNRDTDGLHELPESLHNKLLRLEREFDVDTTKLKDISRRFEEELQDGLERYGANIVSTFDHAELFTQVMS